jgi:hypothetical protein
MFGSLINRIEENQGQKDWSEIEIGEGVTQYLYTDRKAYSVVEKKDKGVLRITQDTTTRTDTKGMSDTQSYDYETNWDEEGILIKMGRDGSWGMVIINQETGRFKNVKYGKFSIGSREKYHDYSF